MDDGGAARGLVEAEHRLRAAGLTGAQAFDALLGAIRARLGESGQTHPAAREAIASLPLDGDLDLLGLAYERFFADLFKGQRGQYFTPRPLVELLLAGAGVGPGDVVLDPTCGSGGFLVCAARRGARVRGIEQDPYLASLASLNLRLAGIAGEVRRADFFACRPDPVDVVVANPPFSVAIEDPEVLGRYALGCDRSRVLSDWLFVEALERWVRPGGRAAIVLPFSVLVNGAQAVLRERLEAGWVREAVCALPEGVFRPFGGAAGRAALLWLRRRPCEEVRTRWAEVDDPGYDVRLQRVRPTGSDQLERLARGEGWTPLPEGAWTPAVAGPRCPVRPLPELAALREGVRRLSATPASRFALVDLGDTDKRTGEVVDGTAVLGAEVRGQKAVLAEGDVLVSRLRPELGNVAILRRPPGVEGALAGSTEWIPLVATGRPHFLLHALRTPAWREQLGITGGQTRPRTSREAVLQTGVPWPGEDLASRIDRLAEDLHQERARLRARLLALQEAMDAFAAGAIDEAGLEEAVRGVEEGRGFGFVPSRPAR